MIGRCDAKAGWSKCGIISGMKVDFIQANVVCRNMKGFTRFSPILCVHHDYSFTSCSPHHQVTMVNVKWSQEETAVLVYFASRNADHEACGSIVGRKCGVEISRTASAVRMKLDEVRRNNVELWDSKSGWDRGKVDEWLVALGLPNLGALVEVGFEELQVVIAVRCAPWSL